MINGVNCLHSAQIILRRNRLLQRHAQNRPVVEGNTSICKHTTTHNDHVSLRRPSSQLNIDRGHHGRKSCDDRSWSSFCQQCFSSELSVVFGLHVADGQPTSCVVTMASAKLGMLPPVEIQPSNTYKCDSNSEASKVDLMSAVSWN